jgi:HD-like signal output (HDOD) protein/ActR/RegA family two-component response regulator
MDILQQKKRILFVDDEPHLLAGLRRSLRGQRGEWEMFFVDSGEEALRLLDENEVDVVVSDMLMPGMNGAQLLREVALRHPLVIRMVLSGHSDEKSILSLVGTAHRFLAKPCDVETLKSVLSRAFMLQGFLRNEKLQALVSSLGSLPSLPAIYQKLIQMLHSPDATLREIGRLISEDPPMTAKLLQVVNSAFFGVGRRITNPEEAATLLGLETLSSLILSAGIFHQFEGARSTAESLVLERLWHHSVSVGRLAQEIAHTEGCDRVLMDDSLTAGLLHDIGLLLIAFKLPSLWEETRQLVTTGGGFHWDAEQRLIGATHAGVGAYLLGLWGLPDSIVESIAFTHSPSMVPAHHFDVLTAVHVADALVHDDGRLDEGYLKALGLEQRLDAWQELRETIPMDTWP